MDISFVPVVGILGPETWIIVAVAGAVLIFGADKLPKLARSAGQAKKEFLVGQAEADVAAERAREAARREAEARTTETATITTPSGTGVPTPPPDPSGTTISSTAPPRA